MSVHIGAKKGDIADKILLPGDPLRAKYIAETFLDNVSQYNHIRGMYGYTGTYKGERISVQGTGMGVPSIAIYITELMQEYDVQTLIRVGSCGAIQRDINVRDIILSQNISQKRFLTMFPNITIFAVCMVIPVHIKASGYLSKEPEWGFPQSLFTSQSSCKNTMYKH